MIGLKKERDKYTAGVYILECRRTGYVYIGSSICIERRIEKHFGQLREGRHGNTRLQIAYNMSPATMKWRIVEIAPDHFDRIDIYAMERHWFTKFDKKFNILEDPTDHINYDNN